MSLLFLKDKAYGLRTAPSKLRNEQQCHFADGSKLTKMKGGRFVYRLPSGVEADFLQRYYTAGYRKTYVQYIVYPPNGDTDPLGRVDSFRQALHLVREVALITESSKRLRGLL